MVKSDIISAAKANRFYWLGRYVDRVYMTLHLLNKCYDRMIDGAPDEYMNFWQRLDAGGCYATEEEFTLGMMYDDTNPTSVLSALMRAMDNAILLREDILSESLSYIEMSLALMKRCKAAHETNITQLQSVIDWSLAFWGSAEQRLHNPRSLSLMMAGRHVENIDMLLRFGYSFRRVSLAYDSLKRYARDLDDEVDREAEKKLDALIVEDRFDLTNRDYRDQLLGYVNQLVRV